MIDGMRFDVDADGVAILCIELGYGQFAITTANDRNGRPALCIRDLEVRNDFAVARSPKPGDRAVMLCFRDSTTVRFVRCYLEELEKKMERQKGAGDGP
jgi:hypothetical protein